MSYEKSNMVIFETFNKFYQVLSLYKYASKFELVVEYNNFTFTAKRKSTQDFTTLKVERGYDSVGASIPNSHPTNPEMWEVECDLFLAYAKEFHFANPVQEREHASENYINERRFARSNM